MSLEAGKMNAKAVWLFALGAVVLGIGGAYLTSGMPWKISSAIYFAIFCIMGFAATYLTDAKRGTAYLAFVMGALATGAIYFVLVKMTMEAAVTVMADAASLGTADKGQTAEVGSFFGNVFGIFVAVLNTIATLVAGIGGCVAGRKFKAMGGFSAAKSELS